ncbi:MULTISPECIES: hypothetical protein [unclassified Flavobacterium]|uniref:hypothetical protein n=1 Tax=unclassified Flavobacterium TaxID=196869 RepID=UPI0012A9FF3C|nr:MULTISPECIES: hypothetical protein [unclassified Flavobacterium]MBF4487341.1 hypothetical protein [Flavobacterium sp. CSZ]QGK72729.1 hypothetical protein GIY83_01190 [Flavobacterium sp. SLB02]
MCNNTVEDYYKKAVRKKYEEVKNGVNFNFLNSPTRGKLRTLCWELFETQNMRSDDLIVFNSLLGFPFDINAKNNFKKHSNEFRPIETFLKGETEPLSIEVVDMAAILVGFESRPFNKFRIHNLYPDQIKSDDDIILENQPRRQSESSGDLGGFLDEKEREKGIEKGSFTTQTANLDEGEKGKTFGNSEITPDIPEQQRLSLFKKIKEKVLHNFLNRLKNTVIATVFVFGLISAVIYFAFFKNHCMQWSQDHYEVVDCSSENGNTNDIIPLDKNLLDFKKLNACDTTTCFKKNGEAFVWYAKTSNGIDFFNDNGNGRHPECKKSLRPVSQYIFKRYLKGKSCE